MTNESSGQQGFSCLIIRLTRDPLVFLLRLFRRIIPFLQFHNLKERSERRIVTGRLLALTAAGVSAVMDIHSMRISNIWIVCSLLAGLWQSAAGSGPGIPGYLAGMILPLILLGWMFPFRLIGAGDIKLFCALGGIMGGEDILWCIGYAFLSGAAISLALLVSCGGLGERIRCLLEYFSAYLRTGIVKPYYRKGGAPENIHFSIPIFMSVMLYTGGIY